MTRAAVSFSASALDDLEGIRAWYEEQGEREVGHRLIETVFERVRTPADHPDLGRVVPQFGQEFLRELIEPPFRIVYRRDPGKVRVVRVWRS